MAPRRLHSPCSALPQLTTSLLVLLTLLACYSASNSLQQKCTPAPIVACIPNPKVSPQFSLYKLAHFMLSYHLQCPYYALVTSSRHEYSAWLAPLKTPNHLYQHITAVQPRGDKLQHLPLIRQSSRTSQTSRASPSLPFL